MMSNKLESAGSEYNCMLHRSIRALNASKNLGSCSSNSQPSFNENFVWQSPQQTTPTAEHNSISPSAFFPVEVAVLISAPARTRCFTVRCQLEPGEMRAGVEFSGIVHFGEAAFLPDELL